MQKVLVTAGTGFIPGHCVKQLLEKDYEVVVTVRSSDKGEKVLKAYPATAKLSYQIVPDIAQEGAFDEAIKSTPNLTHLIHSASPFHYNVQDPIKDFLNPAITGTTSILHAITRYSPTVRRVVITSSFAAMRARTDSNTHYNESSWNPITWDEAATNPAKTYQGSKALSERAAWDFVAAEKPNFDLVTVNPTLVFGPAAPHLGIGDVGQVNTSNLRILDMLDGKMKETLKPTGFYTWVDVRDVARAHVNALEIPQAGGQRFFLIAGYFTNREVAKVVAGMGYKGELPEDLDTNGEYDDLPQDKYTFDHGRSVDVLGVKYLDLETSVRDTVESLVKLK